MSTSPNENFSIIDVNSVLEESGRTYARKTNK